MSSFWHRLKYYLIGFLLGLLLVSVLFRERTICKMPGTLKREELQKQPVEYTRHALCRMQCRGISKEEIREVLNAGKINYSKSEVQAKPCPKYVLEGKAKDGQELRIVVGDCDSISRIITAIDLDLAKDTCNCR